MNNHKAEVMYKSPECTPNGEPFLTVKKARGYYYYAERGGVDSIFFVLYDASTGKFGLIRESKPPRDEQEMAQVSMTTAFGGSLDDYAKTKKQIVKMEVLEEAGYKVPKNRIHKIGKTLVSSQSSQVAHGYLVSVTDIPRDYETEGQETVWMYPDQICNHQDWKSMFIILRAKQLGVVA
ncbi:MAG: hypothetical protein DRG30_08625 [Epsilonproteobacteria bacterium]|nr:MAG: hypothetical protein DRG30_08625 [Campylobacterota bacterium]